MSKTKKWIQSAVKRPGALRERLEKLGLVKPDRVIPLSVLKEAASGKFGERTKQRARFAITLRGLRHK